jgi:hypothetical protein
MGAPAESARASSATIVAIINEMMAWNPLARSTHVSMTRPWTASELQKNPVLVEVVPVTLGLFLKPLTFYLSSVS